MPSPLERLSSLVAEPADEKEFAGLKRSGLVRLKDASNAVNSLESRFDLAYNAAHSYGTGLRPPPGGLCCFRGAP